LGESRLEGSQEKVIDMSSQSVNWARWYVSVVPVMQEATRPYLKNN
jgi:hypothetical protein